MNKVLKDGNEVVATLDRDDTRGNGCETITVDIIKDKKLTYSVYNYSGESIEGLSASNAKVTIYRKGKSTQEFYPPKGKKGYTWDVFEYIDNKINETNKIR